MFEVANSISYYINREDVKNAEMEIFSLEFDHEPKTKMICLVISSGDKVFKQFYSLRNEFNKWYFVAL